MIVGSWVPSLSFSSVCVSVVDISLEDKQWATKSRQCQTFLSIMDSPCNMKWLHGGDCVIIGVWCMMYDGLILSTCTWSFTSGVPGSGQKSTWFSITSGTGVEEGEVCTLPDGFLGREDKGLLSGRSSWLRSSTPGRKGRRPSWLCPSTIRLFLFQMLLCEVRMYFTLKF